MQAPKFWYQSIGLRACALWPMGRLYAWATAKRVKNITKTQPAVPTICIGNINVGGTGKTPTTIALARYFCERGIAVHIVSRGYGAKITSTFAVDPMKHTAAQTGDEPLIMAAFTKTWVTPNRTMGIQAAAEAGAQVVLVDDGFQDPSFARTLSLVVVDAQQGFGNGLCLPAGPLREPVAAGLARADGMIVIGDDPIRPDLQRTITEFANPVLRAALHPVETGMDWTQGRYLAFAGIGQPDKFYKTLTALGANIVETVNLDDHQPLTPALIKRLAHQAHNLGADLITTEKDAVRLPKEYQGNIPFLPVRLQMADTDQLSALLDPVIAAVKTDELS